MRKNTRIAVNVPAGIDNGQTLIMHGEGEDGLRGGQRGDLNISVTVRPHKIFRRKGYDLYLELPLAYTTAARGGDRGGAPGEAALPNSRTAPGSAPRATTGGKAASSRRTPKIFHA